MTDTSTEVAVPVSRETGSSVDLVPCETDPRGPVLISRGTYALYRTPEEGIHLSLWPEGEETETHHEIPPAYVAVAENALRGELPSVKDVMKLLKDLKGLRR